MEYGVQCVISHVVNFVKVNLVMILMVIVIMVVLIFCIGALDVIKSVMKVVKAENVKMLMEKEINVIQVNVN